MNATSKDYQDGFNRGYEIGKAEILKQLGIDWDKIDSKFVYAGINIKGKFPLDVFRPKHEALFKRPETKEKEDFVEVQPHCKTCKYAGTNYKCISPKPCKRFSAWEGK